MKTLILELLASSVIKNERASCYLATRERKLDKRCNFWHFLTGFVKTGQSALAAIRSADDDLTSAYT